MKDSFIDGLASSDVWQRLLDRDSLTKKWHWKMPSRTTTTSRLADWWKLQTKHLMEFKEEDKAETTVAAIKEACVKCGGSKPHDHNERAAVTSWGHEMLGFTK